MKNLLRGLVTLSFLGVAIIAANSQFTDADLFDQESVTENSFQATTIDFTTHDTATELSKATLFSIAGMVPTGFQVETVRLKNSGELEFPYSINVAQTAGTPQFCESLELVLMQDWSPVYSGALLTTQFSGELTRNEAWEDLVFILKMPSSDASLKNQQCTFTISLTTTLPGSRFSDTEILQNTVSSGTWAQ